MLQGRERGGNSHKLFISINKPIRQSTMTMMMMLTTTTLSFSDGRSECVKKSITNYYPPPPLRHTHTHSLTLLYAHSIRWEGSLTFFHILCNKLTLRNRFLYSKKSHKKATHTLSLYLKKAMLPLFPLCVSPCVFLDTCVFTQCLA